MVAPVSSLAFLVAFVAVFPLTPGSEEITSRTTFWGISTDKIFEFSEFTIIVTTRPSLKKHQTLFVIYQLQFDYSLHYS